MAKIVQLIMGTSELSKNHDIKEKQRMQLVKKDIRYNEVNNTGLASCSFVNIAAIWFRNDRYQYTHTYMLIICFFKDRLRIF